MPRAVKWAITLVVGAVVFVLGWWVCDFPLGMETGNALSVAALPSALIMSPLGWWAGREASVRVIGEPVPSPQEPAPAVRDRQVVVGPVPRKPQHFQPPVDAVHALSGIVDGTVAVVCTVTGLRGVGKTQAAGAYARQRIADGWLVAWLPAQSEELVVAGLAELADALGLRRPGDTTATTTARVRNHLQTLREPALLVFDNVTDPAHVVPHLPATGSAQIVLTSASHTIDQLGTRVPVDLFSLGTAVRFLTDSTGLPDTAGARKLARELGCLPLALAQAAARVVRIDHDYATYLRRHQSVAVDRLLTAVPGDPYPLGAAKAIMLAIEPFTADETHRMPVELLDLLSVLSPDGVSRDLLTAGLDGDADDALAALLDASLVEFAGTDNAIVVMHRLTQRAIRDRADHDLPAALTRAAGLVRVASRPAEQAKQKRDLGEELIRHLDTLRSHATAVEAPPGALDGFLGLRADALYDLSEWYWRHDRPVAERILLRQALPLYRRLARAGTNQRSRLASCLHHIGASYLNSGVADRAATTLYQAYELRVALADADDDEVASLAATCAQLCRALLMTSRFREAVRIAEHEVRLRRGRSGSDGDLYFGLVRLARGQVMVGEDAAAWRTALEVEELCETSADDEPTNVAWRQLQLARVLSVCGRHDPRRAARAEGPARAALRAYRRLVDQDPRDHQATLKSAVATLVTVLERLGRHAEALEVTHRIGADPEWQHNSPARRSASRPPKSSRTN
ncbi:hypothetical protein QRX60_30655 [Amycolatopsis mongoliensis]|uniref:Tetratricopeptide repeat protein n=1 Tax=Amycolatopsis mongoliensis TaxID=715475 RepID=A0A9Y2JJ42_9PSEU|nr:hypothetical protein [Amycolatopsis sp. 4-36]WIX98415.1 hypothetical protein QRX60_30655 [Amycolatopsis sp. 4-36]